MNRDIILPMKILLSSDCYTFQTGGINRVVLSLAEGLISLGHKVKVLALSNRNESFKDGYNYYIRSIQAFYYPDQRLSFARRDSLLKELADWHPDIIHLHTEGACKGFVQDIAKKDHIPIIMTAHTDYARFVFGRFYNIFPVRLFFRVWGQVTYHGKAAVILPSKKACSYAQFEKVTCPLFVIPSGIMKERYQRRVSREEKAELLSRLQLTDNGLILIMVTRISREKNIIEILRCFRTLLKFLPGAQLLIVGDGPDRKRLESCCRRWNLAEHVRFTGRIDPDEVYRYYAIGDVFVSASTFESQGLTYLEAEACGLPLICREDPVLQNVLVNGQNGFIYRSEKEFVLSALRIMKNRRLWQSMHRENLKKSEHFGPEQFVKQHLSVYEQVLNRQ